MSPCRETESIASSDFLYVLPRDLVARINIESVHKLGQGLAVVALLAKLFPSGDMSRGSRKTGALPRRLVPQILRILLKRLQIVLIRRNNVVLCLG